MFLALLSDVRVVHQNLHNSVDKTRLPMIVLQGEPCILCCLKAPYWKVSGTCRGQHDVENFVVLKQRVSWPTLAVKPHLVGEKMRFHRVQRGGPCTHGRSSHSGRRAELCNQSVGPSSDRFEGHGIQRAQKQLATPILRRCKGDTMGVNTCGFTCCCDFSRCAETSTQS